jgi:DNA excision repair protein ERCC-6
LFCRLTALQRQAYEYFLKSDEMTAILEGRRNALFGVDLLRKNCNHPDLVEHKTLSIKPGYNYGDPKKSGKMQVVKSLLETWKSNGNKTLLFAQHRIMLDILEKFVKNLDGINYRRMDGTTDIKHRQQMVDEFNRDPNIHLFLLTTKVGGLGVNLTGADRVIIYDPDWNPSTDVQARERAWRLGQKREVEIYRLMTAGTIEEKIYHRQIFKQFLSNKILKDPKQRQTFNLSDLHDLFTLGGAGDDQTETSNIFKGSEVKWTDKGIAETRPENNGAPKPSESSNNTSTPATQLASIKGISRQEDYAPESTTDTAAAEGSSSAPKDPSDPQDQPDKKSDRLLSTIFSRADLHSAIEHDAVLSSRTGKPKVTADPEVIRREARRVADQAARSLRRAAEAARTLPAGTPTWTGVYGSGGRPEEPRATPTTAGRGRGRGRGGPASSGVLANLAMRQGTAAGGPSTSSPGPAGRGGSAAGQLRGQDLAAQIRDFLVAQGGACYTQMIVDHFQARIRGPERVAEFEACLKRIAVLDKGRHTRGRGRWILKEEFGGRG